VAKACDRAPPAAARGPFDYAQAEWKKFNFALNGTNKSVH